MKNKPEVCPRYCHYLRVYVCIYIFSFLYLSTDYQKFSSDYSHSVVGGTSSARGMRSASELRDLMDTLQRKKIALENSLRANGNGNPSYFSVTQVGHVFTLLSVALIKHSLLSAQLAGIVCVPNG